MAEDADAVLDRYQSPARRGADESEAFHQHAEDGVEERDADEILEALEQHHARAARSDPREVRGTADLAPTTPTSRPRRHQVTGSRWRRWLPLRNRTAYAISAVLVVVGLGVGATAAVTGGHRSAARAPHPSRATTRPMSPDMTAAAAEAERAVVERARRAGPPSVASAPGSHAAASTRTRHHRARQPKHARDRAPMTSAGASAADTPSVHRPGHHDSADDDGVPGAGTERPFRADQPPCRAEPCVGVWVKRDPRAGSLPRLLTESEAPVITTILRHFRSQAVAYAALFVALGGTGYAAANLPAHSVGARQLRRGAVGNAQIHNHSVAAIKLAPGSIAGYVRDYAQVNGQGLLVASRPTARLIGWVTTGPSPGGLIQFNRSIPAACFALATMQGGPGATYATAQAQTGGGHDGGGVLVTIAPPQNTGNSILPQVNVAVICPVP